LVQLLHVSLVVILRAANIQSLVPVPFRVIRYTMAVAVVQLLASVARVDIAIGFAPVDGVNTRRATLLPIEDIPNENNDEFVPPL